MSNSFVDRASDSLVEDLGAYISAIRDFVSGYPRVIELCDMVIKEATLGRALLAFAPGPVAQEISLRLYRFLNRWPFRDQPFRRTQGFSEEIAEAQGLRNEAREIHDRVMRSKHDPLLLELAVSFENILKYLEEEEQLLSVSHEQIQPYVKEMDMIRKRLDLLTAALDARMTKSPAKDQLLKSYREAGKILHEWEHGVPLDQEGLEILERCLDVLTDQPAAKPTVIVTPVQLGVDHGDSSITDGSFEAD